MYQAHLHLHVGTCICKKPTCSRSKVIQRIKKGEPGNKVTCMSTQMYKYLTYMHNVMVCTIGHCGCIHTM